MSDWKPISTATPKAGDMALIIAYRQNGWGEWCALDPQLCVWEQEDGEGGWWNQMLRGSSYGMGVDGTPRLFMLVPKPA